MDQPRFVNEHFKLPLAARELDYHTALMVTLVTHWASCAKVSAPWTYDLEMKIAFFWLQGLERGPFCWLIKAKVLQLAKVYI